MSSFNPSDVEIVALILGALAFLAALSFGVIFTPIMHHYSWKWRALDEPDGTLKCHTKPTATLGGVPLFFAIIVGMSVLLSMNINMDLSGLPSLELGISWGALLLCGVVILSIGIADDLFQVKPRTKILFQMLASTVLIGSGLVIHHVDCFDVFSVRMGAMAVPFTLFWLVGSCNAYNFIDGMDGLASGIGVVAALALAALGFYSGIHGPAIVALALAGALCAMLLFNVKPAMIFLGDSGSQLVGLILGALSIKIATVSFLFALPIAGLIMSVPIIDAFLAIVRRFSSHESPANGDHRHIHHCLRKFGFSVNQTVILLCSVSALAGVLAISFRHTMGPVCIVAAVAFVLLELYLGMRMGCLKVSEMTFWLKSLVSAFGPVSAPQENALQASAFIELEDLWNRMKPHFETMKLDRAVLTLEGVGVDGKANYQTYQWSRTNNLAQLLSSRWTKRFSIGEDKARLATLRLESVEQLRQDEQRIDWLLKQIRNNVQYVSNANHDTNTEEIANAKGGMKVKFASEAVAGVADKD